MIQIVVETETERDWGGLSVSVLRSCKKGRWGMLGLIADEVKGRTFEEGCRRCTPD